jgi:hypothetical protein
MRSLTDNDIDFIIADLEKRGLTMPVLKDELTDHICCLIEPDLENGIDFVTSYNSLVNNLEDNIFRDIQHNIMLSANLKYQKMKKTMFVLGIIGSLLIMTGAFSKVNNIPIGGLGLSLGLLIIIFGFLPLFYFTAYKEKRDKKNILLDIAGYVTVTLFILSVLFSNQHWPGAAIARNGSLLFAIFIFAPLYMVTVFRKANETKSSVGYLMVILLIAIGGIYIVSATRMEKGTKESYAKGYREANSKFAMVRSANDSLYSRLGTKDLSPEVLAKVTDLRKVSTILSLKTDRLQDAMVKVADGDSATLENFTSLSDRKAFYKVLLSDMKNSNVSSEVVKFKFLAKTLCPNPVDQGIVEENIKS